MARSLANIMAVTSRTSELINNKGFKGIRNGIPALKLTWMSICQWSHLQLSWGPFRQNIAPCRPLRDTTTLITPVPRVRTLVNKCYSSQGAASTPSFVMGIRWFPEWHLQYNFILALPAINFHDCSKVYAFWLLLRFTCGLLSFVISCHFMPNMAPKVSFNIHIYI